MLIGWCTSVEQAELVRRTGYDYVELPLASQSLEGSESERRAARAAVVACPLPTLAFNYFFPRDMRIVGEAIDRPRLDTYLARAAELLVAAKAKAAVLGSAWARNVPDGFDRDRAEAQILDALSLAAERFAGSGCAVVIEPLYQQESNIINSVAEAAAYARKIDRPEVRVLADFFHMDEEDEPFDTLYENRHWLAHVHLADTGRYNPGSGSYPYDRFLTALSRAGYDGTMSAECKTRDPETDMRTSAAFLRDLISKHRATKVTQ